MIDAGEFDYVIAGGGTAGCVLAARLSEDPSLSVCLLEAGPSDVEDPAILRLEAWMYLLDSGYDWDYLVEPQEKGNSPGVGANLDDHVEGIVQWEATQPMVRTSTQFWEIGLFAHTEDGLDRPDLMMHYGSLPFDMNTARWGYPTTENGFCLTPNVCRGRSRGTVRLRSPDYRDRARVDPRYFTDLDTVYHPACTAHMGPDSDPLAVVDPRLRVRGVESLRIADGSILPFLPAINPCITTMMVGEKCADMIKRDARASVAELTTPATG